MSNKTNTYLEGNENELVHIFYEFYIFLYLLNHDSKECQELHNIIEDARRLHSRVIMDFFSDTGKNDDIVVKNIVKDNVVSSYLFDKEKYSDIRTMINKATAHLTEASCKSTIYPDGLEEKCKEFYVELVKMITNFTGSIDTIIKSELKAKLQDNNVCNLINNITDYSLNTILNVPQYFIKKP